jgi:hypothetical protein
MSEKQKIIVENYPVEKLPEDLRRGMEQLGKVRVTVETANSDREKPLAAFVGSAKGCYATPEEAVSAVRSLRDEWE